MSCLTYQVLSPRELLIGISSFIECLKVTSNGLHNDMHNVLILLYQHVYDVKVTHINSTYADLSVCV